jgi:hypothetical protein
MAWLLQHGAAVMSSPIQPRRFALLMVAAGSDPSAAGYQQMPGQLPTNMPTKSRGANGNR